MILHQKESFDIHKNGSIIRCARGFKNPNHGKRLRVTMTIWVAVTRIDLVSQLDSLLLGNNAADNTFKIAIVLRERFEVSAL